MVKNRQIIRKREKDRMMKIAGSVGKMVGESAPLLQRSRVGSALSFFFDFFEVE